MPITTDGKAPDLKHFLVEIRDCIQKATRSCQRAHPTSKTEVSLKDAILRVLPASIESTSANGMIEFPQRNLYYTVRKAIQPHTGASLTQGRFDQVIAEYEEERGPIP